MYIKGIKYANSIEIGSVAIEIQWVENGNLVVPVNNPFVCHMIFLATDAQPCVLMYVYVYCRIH